jgi:chromosomal replication initiator protein
MSSVENMTSSFEQQSFEQQWERVRVRLRAELGEDIFSSWFKSMELDRVEGQFVFLSVPTRFLKSWIQSHYTDRLLRLWGEELNVEVKLEVGVRNGAPRVVSVKPKVELEAAPLTLTENTAIIHQTTGSPVDPRLTFESFLQGRSNTLARAAAQQIGTSRAGDAVLFNPLYIHAGVGLGKSHLLQAIANSAQITGRKVLYLTAEKFMYGFVTALKNQTAIAYKEALRSIDILIIDDLQFLQGKTTQVEFCHTLNALVDSGKQVVIAADRAASDLEALEERIKSRLAGGLSVEIGLLDENLRMEILRQKLRVTQVAYPEFDIPPAVLGFVAQNVTQNGRDLEGAFNRLLAQVRLTGQEISVETAERSIRDLIKIAEPKRVKIEDIQRIVAKHYNVSRADILSARRTAGVVKPRQIAMYLAKSLTLRSLPEIGRRFGGRDHTTVLHAVRKIDTLTNDDKVFFEELEMIKRMIAE